MHLTPTLWLEIAGVALIAVIVIWTKPEYGLFFYALALGFPDLAVSAGNAVNVRPDDILMFLFLGRTVLWKPAPLSLGQKRIVLWQGIFFAACLFSILAEIGAGNPPGGYDAAKMAGCAAIFLVLPRTVQSERRLRFLLVGLVCAGFALAIQVVMHLGEARARQYQSFQGMKNAATFATWNPNTIGQAALLLVFAAGFGGIAFSGTRTSKLLWACLAAAFASIPALVFVRGTTVSIAAGFTLFLFLTRRWKSALLLAAAALSVILYLRAADRPLVEDATTVNLSTGEGLSHRFERWGMAFEGIREAPFTGQGFGQELPYLTLLGSEGRAHNAYLAVWLELGLGGLLLFVAAAFQFVRAGWLLYANPNFRSYGALLLALIFALCLDSFGLPTLYWEKLPTIALSLAVAVTGLCERSACQAEANEVPPFFREPVPETLEPVSATDQTTS